MHRDPRAVGQSLERGRRLFRPYCGAHRRTGGAAYGTIQIAAERSFLIPIRSASPTSKNTYSLFRGRSPHSANPRERPSIKRRSLEMWIPQRCGYRRFVHRNVAASTICYGSFSPTSPQRMDAMAHSWIPSQRRDNGSKSTSHDSAHFQPAILNGPCRPQRAWSYTSASESR